jgi:hypothetical protein
VSVTLSISKRPLLADSIVSGSIAPLLMSFNSSVLIPWVFSMIAKMEGAVRLTEDLPWGNVLSELRKCACPQMTVSSQERGSLKHLYSFLVFQSFFVFILFSSLIREFSIVTNVLLIPRP